MRLRCCKCKKPATFDSPKHYCAYHWTKWFTQGWEQLLSPEAYQREFREVLKTASSK